MPPPRSLTWLAPGEPFPPVHHTWGLRDPIPGLLAAGGALDTPTLLQAYRHGIFPWFSEDQPILWWSPDPRMVLRPEAFRLHPSLRKTLRALLRNGTLEVRMDTAFDAVISACAQTPRKSQNGTWIVPSMVEAYRQLHLDGHAHSVETWWNGELAGGLYTVNVGRMVFGESMFSRRTDASKIALAALVACCLQWRVPAIDCQQNTPHLASLGAREMPRADFVQVIEKAIAEPAPLWQFDPVYWNSLLS
jgi:leucyl/phenylalanyl-tRNA---protein transferase